MQIKSLFASVLIALPLFQLQADEPEQPKPIPANRQEMLEALDRLKHRQPRLPMPPADVAAPVAAPTTGTGLPNLGVVNNARMRAFYLPEELQQARPPGQGQNQQSTGDLSYAFTTELFWIVSRVNNCHYCLGHQEAKLHQAGVTEPELLALDTDWTTFPAKQQAAFTFTRKLTFEPFAITDQDIESLRKHFSDEQILAITFLVGRYNSTNRWTDSLGIPQEDHREFKSSLDAKATQAASRVVATELPNRPHYDSFAAWHSQLEKHAARKPRFKVQAIEDMQPHEAILTCIEGAGAKYVDQLRKAATVGELPGLLKDQIAFVAAQADCAWYMQQVALRRLNAQGLDAEAVYALSQAAIKDDATSAAIAFTKKLTATPQAITDADIDRLSKFFNDRQIAEIVYHTGNAALVNRLTEAVGLGYEI